MGLRDGRWSYLADGVGVDAGRQALENPNGRRIMTDAVTTAIDDAIEDERIRAARMTGITHNVGDRDCSQFASPAPMLTRIYAPLMQRTTTAEWIAESAITAGPPRPRHTGDASCSRGD